MLKDIPELQVENIAVAIVKEKNKLGETEWNSYLLNLKDKKIEGVLVSSTGYGEINNEQRRSSTLRHFLDTLEPHTACKIEPIVEDVFALSNEYWVSFFLNDTMYDKKYIFLPDSISESNFVMLPILNKKGVIIK
jgi:hypothetical protein